METVVENIVAMVQQYPAGVPLKKLAVLYSQTYRKNLTLSFLGFESTPDLVASLDRDLVVKGELVFYKDRKDRESQARAGASAKATEDDKKIKNVQEKIVAMMKEHPDGILLKKVAIAYSQKYHQQAGILKISPNHYWNFLTKSMTDLEIIGNISNSQLTIFHV